MITFIVPVYNGERTIEKCIKSILAQDFEKEIIAVDNNSNDNTAKILQKFPVRYLLEKKRGAAAARNKGLREINEKFTKYVVFVDADVILPHGWLKKAIRILELSGDIVAGVGGPGKGVDKNYISRSLDRLLWYPINRNTYVNSLATMDVCYKYEIIKGTFFNEEFFMGEDPEFNFQLAEKGYKLIFSPELFVYHNHPLNFKQLIKKWYRYGQYYPLPYFKHPSQITFSFLGRLLYCPLLFIVFVGSFLYSPFKFICFPLVLVVPLTYFVIGLKIIKNNLKGLLQFIFVHSVKQYAQLFGIWKGILLGRKILF